MALYGLIRIKLDSHGRIEMARLREIDPKNSCWISDAMEMPANRIARMIGGGDVVTSIFEPTDKYPFRRTGATLRMKSFAGHGIGVELERETDGKTIYDLAKFD